MSPSPDSATPTSAPQLERALLGVLLLNDNPPPGFDSVDESLFATAELRILWRAIATQVASTGRADPAILIEDLRLAKSLDETDPAVLVTDLMGSVLAAPDLPEYVSRLRELRDRRELAVKLRKSLDRLTNSSEAIEDIRAELFAEEATSGPTGIIEPMQARERFLESLNARLRGEDRRLATGYTALDDVVGGLTRGSLTIVAGRPSMGKSSLALGLARHVVLAGSSALFFALETTCEEITGNWCAIDGDVDTWRLRNSDRLAERDFDRIGASLARMGNAESGLFVDDGATHTIESIAARIRAAKRKSPTLGLVVVDHLGLVCGVGQTREQEIASISRGLKLVAKQSDVAVLALSQLNRGTETREDRRPRLADLRDSGAIEQDADLILLLYRDEYYHPDREESKGRAEVNIAKHRNGPTGNIDLAWDAQYVRFSDRGWAEDSWTTPESSHHARDARGAIS